VHNVLKGTSMMKVLCTRAACCESGATGMEYALTAAIISVALLTGAETLGNAINDKFSFLSKKVAIASEEMGQSGGGTSLVSLQAPQEGQLFVTGSTSRVPQP
jgi:pilus assembly protein Flp/PilA